MRYELKSIPIWPLTKVAFFVHLVVGFLVGLLYAALLFPFMAALMNLPEFQAEELGIVVAPLGIVAIMMPFVMALSGAFFGTIFTVILAAVYNLIARLLGGLELNLAAVESAVTASGAAASRSPVQSAPVDRPPPPPPPVADSPPPPPPVDRPPGDDTAPGGAGSDVRDDLA
ncbi:MAG: DUF3566 domain-containing protein [Candidatus Zixiibacteriota bacterium]|nr:MAG: DUF3566 domain-containing protein [candidate division Zixibacteria bacterium]